jgi:hypothetical protein
MFESLEIEGSPFEIEIASQSVSAPSKVTVLLVKGCLQEYETGQYVEVIFEARDDQSNLITSSTTELFNTDFIDSASVTVN